MKTVADMQARTQETEGYLPAGLSILRQLPGDYSIADGCEIRADKDGVILRGIRREALSNALSIETTLTISPSEVLAVVSISSGKELQVKATSEQTVEAFFTAVQEKRDQLLQAETSKPGLPYQTVQEMQDAIGLAIRNGEQPSFDWLSGDFDFSYNLDYSDEGDGDFTLSVEEHNVFTPYFGMETRLQISSEEVSVCVSILHFEDGLGNASRRYDVFHDMKDEITACSDDSLEDFLDRIKETQQSIDDWFKNAVTK